jgi:multidrug efflux pump subunit AcrA (membrane-fusion protein)
MPRKVLAVPRDALVLRRAGTAVYRISDDQSAQRIEVTTGIASGNLIEVQGDLSRGDQVVVRGGERLRPGQKVSILNP